jgi:hypothetical protein
MDQKIRAFSAGVGVVKNPIGSIAQHGIYNVHTTPRHGTNQYYIQINHHPTIMKTFQYLLRHIVARFCNFFQSFFHWAFKIDQECVTFFD